MWFRMTSAVSLAEGSLASGMKLAILEKWSTTVRIVVFPPDSGRPVKNSKDICDQGFLGTGKG